ncbi:MAG: glycosyltransferase family 2 protein [Alicyclobacillus sp.]|nr:glycosyltransferase family 2 protein [Alicyclobacillus sp.]
MLITLCAIVRDDELLVRRMLESVVDLVDEIVIADTGSQDRTMERIQEFSRTHPVPLQLLQYEWKQDFAEARNFTLDHAHGEWILFLDADESLGPCDVAQVRRILETTSHDAFFVKVRNYGGSMVEITTEVDIDSIRLFRRRYRFEGAIHEQVGRSILEAGGTVGQLPLRVHHVGYLAEYREMKRKSERNLDILERQVAAIPLSRKEERWFAQCNLLQEYQIAGRWNELASKGRLLLEELLRLPTSRRPPFTKRVFRQCITGLRKSDRWHEALRIAEEYTRAYSKDTEAWYWLAETFAVGRRYAQAIELFKRCRDMGDMTFDTQEYVAGTGSFLAARGIALCWIWLGDDLSARNWLLTSWEEEPQQAGVVSWLAALVPDEQFLQTMEPLLATPQRYSEFLLACALRGHKDTAEYLQKALERWGDMDFVRRAAFALAVSTGQTPVVSPDAGPKDHIRQGLFLYNQGDVELAFDHWKKAGSLGQQLIALENNAVQEWSIAEWLFDLLAARAVAFLGNHASQAKDFDDLLPYLAHTPLRGILDVPHVLDVAARTPYAWEERALWAMRGGDLEEARHCVQNAVLPDGSWSVRGYLIYGELDKGRQMQIVADALTHYPASELLQIIGRRLLEQRQ